MALQWLFPERVYEKLIVFALKILEPSMERDGSNTFAGVRAPQNPYVFQGADSYVHVCHLKRPSG